MKAPPSDRTAHRVMGASFGSPSAAAVHAFAAIRQIAGAAGKTYLLQASTNLVDWTVIATNVAPAGVFEITDASATNYPYRFYRAVKLP